VFSTGPLQGHLPISRAAEFERFVDHVLKIRRVDFLKDVGPRWSERLVNTPKQFAQQCDRLWEYRPGEVDKDAWQGTTRPVAGAARPGSGLVRDGGLSGPSSSLRPKIGRASRRAKVPQRVLYYYFMDKELGLMHVRLQTWAPFTCQVYANGHDYVAPATEEKRRRLRAGRTTPSPSWATPRRRSAAPDRFAKLPWPENPGTLRPASQSAAARRTQGLSHYWVVDQAEYATDVRFADKHALAGLFSRLLAFALLNFQPQEDLLLSGTQAARTVSTAKCKPTTSRCANRGACIKHFHEAQLAQDVR